MSAQYTVTMDPVLQRSFAELAERKHTTTPDLIRKALATYAYLSGQAVKGGERKISITDQNDQILEDVELP